MTELQLHSFNWFDFVIIGIIAVSIIVSFSRGFLREAVSLVTWVAAVILGLKFSPVLSLHLQQYITSATASYIAAFVLIFLATFVVGLIFGNLVRFLVRRGGLGILDRLAGMVFGVARGVLAVAVLLMFLNVTVADAAWLKSSSLAPRFVPLVTWLSSFVPQQIKQLSQWFGGNDLQINY